MSYQNENDCRMPLGSTFDDVFRCDKSIWRKIGAGAIAVPILVSLSLWRGAETDGIELPDDPLVIAFVLGCMALVGAFLGAALSIKDVVRARMQEGKPVVLPLKLLFGYGVISLVAVWFPLVIFLTLVITALFLP